MYTRQVLKSLPLLAQVLGDQHGVNVTIGGDRACTNGTTVNIPALPLDSDAETLALVRGYIDHEAGGHLRFTDFDAMKKAKLSTLERWLWNAIEDWRVENALCAIYPGCRGNLDWLITRFFANECEPSSDPRTAALNYVLLTLRSWDVPTVATNIPAEQAMADAAYPGLTNAIDTVLSRVRSGCPDTSAALKYAKAIARLIRDRSKAKEQDGQTGDVRSSGSESDDAGQTDANADARQSGKSGSAGKKTCTACGKEPDDADGAESENSTGKGSDDGQQRTGSANASSKQRMLPRLIGERIADGLAAASSGTEEKNRVGIARVLKRYLPSLPPCDVQRALAMTVGLRCRLQGVLQAQTLLPVAAGRQGRLHTPSLHRLYTDNPKVFRKDAHVERTRTAVHILCDASGSMAGPPLDLARKVCLSLARALAPIDGINLAVTAFPAPVPGPSVLPVLAHGEKCVHSRFLFDAYGSTPLTEALLWAMKQLYAQPEERKIILLLTDGAPDNEGTAAQALREAAGAGIEVYGIGIMFSLIRRFLPKTSAVITKLDELPKAVFETARQMLTHRR